MIADDCLGRTFDETADNGGLGEAGGAGLGDDVVDRGRVGGDEQAAAGLRVAQDVAAPIVKGGGKGDGGAVAVPVAGGGAGADAFKSEGFDAGELGGRGGDLGCEAGAARHFESMAEEGEAGDVGEGVDAGRLAKIAAERIELGR